MDVKLKARIYSTIKGHENVDFIKWKHLISALCAWGREEGSFIFVFVSFLRFCLNMRSLDRKLTFFNVWIGVFNVPF